MTVTVFLMDGSCIYIENIIKTFDNHAFLLGRLLQSLGSLYVLPERSLRAAMPAFFVEPSKLPYTNAN